MKRGDKVMMLSGKWSYYVGQIKEQLNHNTYTVALLTKDGWRHCVHKKANLRRA